MLNGEPRSRQRQDRHEDCRRHEDGDEDEAEAVERGLMLPPPGP